MGMDKRIRDARISRNLSINALANKVGVSSTAAWNWDHGHTTPRPDTLERIAKVLNVDTTFLVTGKVQLDSDAGKSGETVGTILADAKSRIAKSIHIGIDQIAIELKITG